MSGSFSSAYGSAFDVVAGAGTGEGEGEGEGEGGSGSGSVKCKLRNFSGRAFSEYKACKRAAAAGAGKNG